MNPDDWRRGLVDAWTATATFVPKFIAFLVILLIGWLIAKLLHKVVDKGLERIGFDRWVERGGIGRMMERSRYDASDLIAKLVYYAVLLITLQVSFSVFGPNPISALLGGVVAWLPKAAVAIIIIVVAAAIANAVKDIISSALGGLSYGRLLATIAQVFIIALGVIAALNQVEIATTVTMPVLVAFLAAVAGILIVGVGGGLVRPMQQRWEGWLNRAEAETGAIRTESAAYDRGRQDAMAGAEAPAPATAPAATARPGTPESARPAQPTRPTQPTQGGGYQSRPGEAPPL
ncbi:hypothetical protein ACFXJ8_34085 [Nonomuraea sp. NPDC059194]|uniref:mechanosensitive ion channel family protein n=1 Tax=Nonomuraea sp. NPDC059194 TaxID=3346764 RepID=UPI0036C264BA